MDVRDHFPFYCRRSTNSYLSVCHHFLREFHQRCGLLRCQGSYCLYVYCPVCDAKRRKGSSIWVHVLLQFLVWQTISYMIRWWLEILVIQGFSNSVMSGFGMKVTTRCRALPLCLVFLSTCLEASLHLVPKIGGRGFLAHVIHGWTVSVAAAPGHLVSGQISGLHMFCHKVTLFELVWNKLDCMMTHTVQSSTLQTECHFAKLTK